MSCPPNAPDHSTATAASIAAESKAGFAAQKESNA
jgi:hypothetical protein